MPGEPWQAAFLDYSNSSFAELLRRVSPDLLPTMPEPTASDGRPAVPHGTTVLGLKFAGEPKDVIADLAVFALPFTVLRDVDTSGLHVSSRRRRANLAGGCEGSPASARVGELWVTAPRHPTNGCSGA